MFNGSLGKVVSANEPYLFDFNDELRELTNEDITKLGIMLGYALTVLNCTKI